VLVTLCQALAPVIPFLTERMYRNLVRNDKSKNRSVPESVHLCEFPQADESLLDPQLSRRMALAQIVVNLGHNLREQSGHRVRQPLPELQFACSSADERTAISRLAEVIQEELNVKKITARDNLDDLVHYNYKPNLKTLGPKFGKGLAAISKALPSIDPKTLAPLRRGESVTLTIDGADYPLAPDLDRADARTQTGRDGPRLHPPGAAVAQRRRPRNREPDSDRVHDRRRRSP
jgi:isoleucyl-tRNA synthetase